MRLSNLTFGADPELFIINERTGNVVSAVGLIPGQKGKPYRAKDMKKGFGLETDNILAEFNIPPAKKKEDFIGSILFMQDYIRNFVKSKNPDLGIKCSASEIVPESELQSDQARMFGCDVDYNCYTQEANPKPKGETTNLRSAGFHIHIGYKNPQIDTSLKLIQYLDFCLGIPSLLRDTDTRRRTLYGRAGCFRLTSYGLEYRVLSSAMMRSEEELEFVWKQLHQAIVRCGNGGSIPLPCTIQNTIDSNDINKAEEIIKKYTLV